MASEFDEEFKKVSHMIPKDDLYIFGVDESVMEWFDPKTLWLIEHAHAPGTNSEFVHGLVRDYVINRSGQYWYDKIMKDYEDCKVSIVHTAKKQMEYLQQQIDDGENPSSEL